MSIKPMTMEDLLGGFTDYLSAADIMAAKLLATVSATIVKKRIDMGYTQKEFAEFMGVTQGMVSKWESENYNYTIEGLANICDKLSIKLEITMKSNICEYKNLIKKNKNCYSNNNWKIPNSNGILKLDEAV